jgi:cysteate synthase
LARRDALAIDAKVLSNRQPPYSIAGGLYDALKATNGEVLQATNYQTRQAAQLFLKTEGIDIHPAAAVSLATLISEVKNGRIERNATIMLNVTGGGEARYKRERQIFHYKPSFTFSLMSKECDVIAKVEELFA